jgi:hypothetical protein
LVHKSARTPEDDLFVFGVEMGNGSSQNHLHLGMTSMTLLNQLHKFKNNGVYHIDATYKILKYAFPVIVFGFTDLNHIYHPLAYMFTSHEEEDDYLHFFQSFLDLTIKYDLPFDPKFMMIDASHAMANAIRASLPQSTILMCYFHLKYNIQKRKPMISYSS